MQGGQRAGEGQRGGQIGGSPNDPGETRVSLNYTEFLSLLMNILIPQSPFFND